MTKITDPIEIYRAALAAAPTPTEEHPPVIERAEVWPYPDLRRLWVRVQTSPFAAYPNLTFTVSDGEGQIVCTMFMVEIREPYQSVTLHLRQEPQPGAMYRLEIELERDEALLDRRELEFALVFREPDPSA
ncbi:MAG: hypothetical protein WHX53_13130 [Anaerolineae bacterium]